MGKARVKLVAAALACLLGACCALGCGSAPSSDEGVAAKYGDTVITEEEVNDYTADFRVSHSYEDDQAWAEYLYQEGLTAETWRNQAIGSIVEEQLVAKRASDLGIVADAELVENQIAADREAAGVAEGDEDAWRAYLEAHGTTAEAYRSNVEAASVQYQLLRQEITLDPVADASVFDGYIDENLISRVVRRYKVLSYDDQGAAQAALDSLAGLSGGELAQAFDALASQDDSDETTPENGGDAGWDIAGDWGDMQRELNDEMLAAGSLSGTVHASGGRYHVVLCTDRFEFAEGTTYADLPDDALKDYVRNAATYASWADMTSDYIAKLRDGADVQVHARPDELPYDVDDMIVAEEGQ